MKVALYTRVSTDDQNSTIQISKLKEYCKFKAWKIHDIYNDQGLSGRNSKRPEFRRLLKDAGKRKFQGVLVWKLDRFGRSMKDLINSINYLQERQIRFLSMTDHIDTDTASGELLLHVLCSVAHFESRVISERVKASYEWAKENGVLMGRQRKIPTQTDIKRMKKQYKAGLSIEEIASLNDFNFSSTRQKLIEKGIHKPARNTKRARYSKLKWRHEYIRENGKEAYEKFIQTL